MTIEQQTRVALITGGTTGIGRATARLFHEQGCSVLVTGQNPDTLAAAKRDLPSEVIVIRADSRSLADADKVAAAVREHFGKLDVAFLNAGIGRMLPIESVDEAVFDEHFDANIKGQFFTLQKILPLLGQGSSVVFNGALGVKKGLPNWSVYSATKGALLGMVPALAIELAPRGIRVNAVSPGPIDTPAMTKLGIPAEARAGLSASVPLGRVGTDEEIASVVAFLASPAASFITGTNVPIDGGMGAA